MDFAGLNLFDSTMPIESHGAGSQFFPVLFLVSGSRGEMHTQNLGGQNYPFQRIELSPEWRYT